MEFNSLIIKFDILCLGEISTFLPIILNSRLQNLKLNFLYQIISQNVDIPMSVSNTDLCFYGSISNVSHFHWSISTHSEFSIETDICICAVIHPLYVNQGHSHIKTFDLAIQQTTNIDQLNVIKRSGSRSR